MGVTVGYAVTAMGMTRGVQGAGVPGGSEQGSNKEASKALQVMCQGQKPTPAQEPAPAASASRALPVRSIRAWASPPAIHSRTRQGRPYPYLWTSPVPSNY